MRMRACVGPSGARTRGHAAIRIPRGGAFLGEQLGELITRGVFITMVRDGAIVAIALVLMTYAGIMKVANGAPIGFSPLC